MELRKLQCVIDELIESISRWPELADDVMRFLFDESQAVRTGLFSFWAGECRALPTGDRHVVVFAVMATPALTQFAAAVAQGVVPTMPLSGDGAGHQ